MYAINLAVIGNYYLPQVTDIENRDRIIQKCIDHVILKFQITNEQMFSILLHNVFESNKNFTYSNYDVSVDDQSHVIIKYEEQEHLHRNFKNILYRRFPIFDENSYVPQKFRKMPHWAAKKKIFDALYNLENKNWTNQTLSYTRSNIIGKHIIECIINPLFERGFFGRDDARFVVVDATAGLGGDSINFGLYNAVSRVISYEINSETFKMLDNNVLLYGLDNGRVTTLNKKFDYKIPQNSLVIIDPPYEKFEGTKNFALSIEDSPIYNVAQKCLDAGAKCVMLTMTKTYKYNAKFAFEHNQCVTVFQMGNKNNKIFLIVNARDALEFGIDNFRSFNISTDETKKTKYGKVNVYKCKITYDT
jgi:16S rRNA G966 N2-methylase RsmD